MARSARIVLLIGFLILTTSTMTAGAQSGATAANVLYAGNAVANDVLDLYVPATGTTPHPVVILYTTSTGNRSDLTSISVPQFVVEQGYAAVVVGYHATLPQSYADAFCALAWVYAHAAQFHLDSSRIALYGVSWGGLVSAFVAATSNPAPYLGQCPNTLPANHALRGVITNSGVFLTVFSELQSFLDNGVITNIAGIPADILQETLNVLATSRPEDFCCIRFEDAALPLLNDFPYFHLNSLEPPHLMIQGVADTVVPYRDTLSYANGLLEAGVNVQLVFDAQAQHVVGLTVYRDQMAAFLKRYSAKNPYQATA